MSRRRNYRDSHPSLCCTGEDEEAELSRPLLPEEEEEDATLAVQRRPHRSLHLIVITFICITFIVVSFLSRIDSSNIATVDDCSAKHIHLAQRNNVNDSGRVSMTVSFAVNRTCASIYPSITYGRQSYPEEEEE